MWARVHSHLTANIVSNDVGLVVVRPPGLTFMAQPRPACEPCGGRSVTSKAKGRLKHDACPDQWPCDVASTPTLNSDPLLLIRQAARTQLPEHQRLPDAGRSVTVLGYKANVATAEEMVLDTSHMARPRSLKPILDDSRPTVSRR